MPEPDARTPRSHTATRQWHSFEVRMRQRRAERCLLRADVALEAGFPDDARQALEEARRLDPSTPLLAELEQRIAVATGAAAAPAAPVRGTYTLGALAAAPLLAVLVALTWIPAQQAERGATDGGHEVAPEPAAPPAVSIREQIVSAVVASSPAPEPSPTPTRPATTPAPAPPRPTEADRPDDVTPPAPPSRTVVTPPVAPAPPPTPNLAPPPVAEPLPPPVAERARASDVEPVPPVAAPAPPQTADELARIQAVLSRYETAYSRLDASAARAIWPAVDERALARAFSGLASQRVSLEQCDVSIDGASATAECAGSATWVPRVGGGGRTEARRWSFDLRNASGAWEIVRAEAR